MPEKIRPEDLHQNTEWLLRLARDLLLDEHEAEDVVQESVLVALQHPAQEEGLTRSWLASVVRNLSRYFRRGERARAVREQRVASTEEGALAAGEVVARAEMLRRLVEHVLALDEPYRTTILLRFIEDLPIREIAARQGTPEPTIRTRVRRGIQQLRERLDQSFGGDRHACNFALLHLVGGAALGGAAVAASGSTAGVTIPIAARMLMIGVAAAGIAMLGYLALPGENGSSVEHRPAPVREAEIVGRPFIRKPDAAAEEVQPIGTREAPREVRSEVPRELSVMGLVTRSGGTPVPGARVRIIRRIPGHRIAFETLCEMKTDTDGRYGLGPVCGPVHVEASAPGLFTHLRRAVPGARRDFVLGPPGTIEGRVIDAESGRPYPNVVVALYEPLGRSPCYLQEKWNLSPWVPDAIARTGSDGRYRLDQLRPASYMYVVLPEDGPSLISGGRNLVRVRAGATVTVNHETGCGAALKGRILDGTTGEPVAGAVIQIENGAQREESHSDGSYSIDGLTSMRDTPVRVLKRGYVAADMTVTIPHRGTMDEDVELCPAGKVIGRVLDAVGRPVQGADVVIHSDDAELRRIATTRTDEEGWYRLPIPTKGDQARVVARAVGQAWRLSSSVSVTSGEFTPVPDLVLTPGGTIKGVVVDSEGAPRPDVTLRLRDADGIWAWSATDARGRFRIPHVPAGRYRLDAWSFSAAEEGRGDHERVFVDPVVVSDSAETDLRIQQRRGATLDGVVVTPAGRPVEGARLLATSGPSVAEAIASGIRQDFRRAKTDARGVFRISGLRRADSPYSILITSLGDELCFKSEMLDGISGGTRNLRIVVQPLALLEGRVVIAGSLAPVTDFWVLVERIAGAPGEPLVCRYQIVDARGRFSISQPESRVRVTIGTMGGRVSLPMELDLDSRRPSAGQTIQLTSGAVIEGTVLGPGGRETESCWIEAYRWARDGPYVLTRASTGRGGRFRIESIPLGDYHLEVVNSQKPVLAAAATVQLKRGDRVSPVLTLAPCGGMEVRVTDKAGAPIEGAWVRFKDRNGSEWLPNLVRQGAFYELEHGRGSSQSAAWRKYQMGLIETGPDGKLHPLFWLPGKYEVTAAAEGYETAGTSVTVNPRKRALVEIRLERN